MRRTNKRIMKLILTMGIVGLRFCATSRVVRSQEEPSKAESQKKSQYREVKKDGRLYVFTSSARKADFENSGELGKGIIKIGYGPNGETVVFDSDEAVREYDKRHVKK